MNRTISIPRLAAALIATLGLSACKGGKTEASKADISVAPDNPIVISADTTLNGTKVSGPWTKFFLTMTNGASEPITIVAVTLNVFAVATLNPQQVAFDPNGMAAASTGTATSTCTYYSFGTWNPGETKGFSDKNGTSYCDIDPVQFTISGMEAPTDKNMTYRYRVVMKALGWFGTFDNPTDRFERQITFYTR